MKFFNLFVCQNASVVRASDRKKAAPAPAAKPDVQELAANGDDAEPESSDSDEFVNLSGLARIYR